MVESESGTILAESGFWILLFPIWFLFSLNYRSYGECIEKAPHYLQTNQYIKSGYRVEQGLVQCCSSIFEWHCETLNIWTQIISGSLFLAELGMGWSKDPWLIRIYIIIIVASFSVSAMAHIFSPFDERTKYILFRLDYLMIYICGVMGGFVGYEYLDHGLSQSTTNILKASGMGMIVPIFWLRSQTDELYRTVRVLSLVGPTGLVFIPQIYHFGFVIATIEIIPFVLGGVLYFFRLPESLAPGNFDIFGHSQQWLHITFAIGHYLVLKGFRNPKVFSPE